MMASAAVLAGLTLVGVALILGTADRLKPAMQPVRAKKKAR